MGVCVWSGWLYECVCVWIVGGCMGVFVQSGWVDGSVFVEWVGGW